MLTRCQYTGSLYRLGDPRGYEGHQWPEHRCTEDECDAGRLYLEDECREVVCPFCDGGRLYACVECGKLRERDELRPARDGGLACFDCEQTARRA